MAVVSQPVVGVSATSPQIAWPVQGYFVVKTMNASHQRVTVARPLWQSSGATLAGRSVGHFVRIGSQLRSNRAFLGSRARCSFTRILKLRDGIECGGTALCCISPPMQPRY